MSRTIKLHTTLYPRESQTDFEALAQDLLARYQPATPDQWEVVELMANASWLKRRYKLVRDRLFLQRNSLPAEDGHRLQIEQSIDNFNREVALQRENLANLRRQWRQITHLTAGRQEDSSHVLVPAA
jgi:hypothetical protein